jgi:hypothetical protein
MVLTDDEDAALASSHAVAESGVLEPTSLVHCIGVSCELRYSARSQHQPHC